MNELQALATFRAAVAAPLPAVRAAARDKLLVTIRGAGIERRQRQMPLRRLGLALAAVAVAVASALAIGTLVDGAPGVVERAQAAIDPRGRVLHVIARVEGSGGAVSVGESWVRPDGTGRTISRSGEPPSDCLASPEALRCYDPAENVIDVYRYFADAVEAGRRYADLPGFRVDQPESIHRAFSAGYARLVGESEIDGKPVYEFQLAIPFIAEDGEATPQFDDVTSPALFLDRETYYPVAERFPDAGSTTYYETYEFLPNDASSARLLELDTKPGARVVVHPVGEGPES
ncbi:MAG: hypothetical protein OEW52_05725 [Thermoleophilia bacterium]|nr:hypothetical protein [Thermoleophilia bacterium]MDH4339386.1 hypothetical protein [Thermoleophilia bacterium]MDH5280637.1 hypothetical protein [Thermoleophilia bacterium]